MKHLKLSACWIVRNEQDDLQRSIDSVKGQVDEMIVVDTGSTDRTVEIAQRAGADVFHFDWIDDFSAPRNYAIEQATGDWIIFLDADEYFIEPKKVRRAVEKFAVKDAILIPRINIDPERGGREVSRDWNARIFRRAPNLRYRGLIHENIANLNGKLEYIFADARLATHHTGYSSARIESKLRRNLKLIELEIERDGHQVRHDIALVDCYYGLGDYERAIEHARRALT
ncbi:MAG: glycosyltransferase family 2 protein, partial [Selenomonadaceae bacterium]|nr:glycosyltransferase family 2 protein [Selenomonadaceae bacterium]